MKKNYENVNMFHSMGKYLVSMGSLNATDLNAKAFVPITSPHKKLSTLIFLTDWGQGLNQYDQTCTFLASHDYLVILLSCKQRIFFNQYKYQQDLIKLLTSLNNFSFGKTNYTANTDEVGLIGHGLGAGVIQNSLTEIAELGLPLKSVVSLFPMKLSKGLALPLSITASIPNLIIENQNNLDSLNSSALELAQLWGKNAILRTNKKLKSSNLPEHSSWRKLISLGQSKKSTQKNIQDLVLGFCDYTVKYIKSAQEFIGNKKLAKTKVISNVNNLSLKDTKTKLKQLF